MCRINFETDLLKHYVRRNGWLNAVKLQKNAIRKRSKKIPLRYFTFCAADAIDVFMLEREGILKRSEETGRLEGVYFCEKDPESFGIIADLIGSPDQGFRGAFEKIVLFEEDQETMGKTSEDESFYPSEIREKLSYKDAHRRLRKAFPFDIINLDVCGVTFPLKKGIIRPLIEAITQILEWQTEPEVSSDERECKKFTLFLTSHIDPSLTDRSAIHQLESRVIENICTNTSFQAAFVRQYGHTHVNQLVDEDFPEFFSVALPKYMIYKASSDLGWKVTCGPTYLYNRHDRWVENKRYQILHTVSIYERSSDFQKGEDLPDICQYSQSVSQLVNDGVQWVDGVMENPNIKQELEEDLKQIVAFRDDAKIP